MFSVSKNIVYSVCKNCSVRRFHVSPILKTFWERDDKGGYRDGKKLPPLKDRLREGLKELKGEIKLWTEEVKERFENDPILIFRPGEVDVKWRFGDEESLKKWNVTCDSDNGEGYSSASLSLTPQGKALFAGNLSMRVPKDGRVKRAGYCNMRTHRIRKSFKRDAHLDWSTYNMLVMKVRGDGRSYLLNIHCKGYYDLTWNDMYHYVLFTRGGPYWQIARIPFSKFYFGSKGRIQDRQVSVRLDRIASFGITAGERYGGDFSLEIDYIGLEFDPNHREEFAYEMYKTDRYIAST
ncbi:complex I intermediate-associated protein 30, mitochondrial [Diorhabda sublineata]|uniref:complex I intermediate-associated protein 30, mitochondrial n=1 Tax=Diorhabda sublineata TaxID=1163346 RepID=UPI0024E05223|nr:complex I intermediate-associated protein 30, mitochondrial [Diorhabda sublineata]